MKKTLMVLCCMLIVSVAYTQKNIDFNMNFGLPITSKKTNFGSFYFEGSVSKPVFRSLFLGLGIHYVNIDLKPTNNYLTYDRNNINTFVFLGNSFPVNKNKASFSPQIKFGYSFYTYLLNEFAIEKQKDNGFFLAPGLSVNYKINDKCLINTHFFYNIIFNSYKNAINFLIPSNYITTQADYISNFGLGIGLSYKIN